MKLEKLNDNQIRCTLNKSDLEKRELRLSELAYGSAKARALFRDMIQQASIELGFEAENIPLMIEAIPISNDCLVLVDTKVEDPDELDTRFSRFSSPFDDEEFEDEYSDDFENSLSDSEVYEEPSSFDDDEEEGLHFGEITDKNIRQAADEALDLIAPFTQAIAQAKKGSPQEEAGIRQKEAEPSALRLLRSGYGHKAERLPDPVLHRREPPLQGRGQPHLLPVPAAQRV